MKKSYIIPATEISLCEAFQLLAGSGEGRASLNPEEQESVKDNGGEGNMADFTNRCNLWDEE